MSITAGLATLRDLVAAVVEGGPGKEVQWVHAGWVVAGVTGFLVRSERSTEGELERDAVSHFARRCRLASATRGMMGSGSAI